jgi:AcrR family transcriptional regulator
MGDKSERRKEKFTKHTLNAEYIMTDSPNQKNNREKQRQISDDAYNIIRTHGIKNLTMRGLATSVGSSASGLYEYFADKDAIVVFVCNNIVATLTTELQNVNNKVPARNYLLSLSSRYLDFAIRERTQLLILYEGISYLHQSSLSVTTSNPTHTLHLSMQGIVNFFEAGITRCIAETVETPSPNFDPKLSGYALYGLVSGFALAILYHSNPPPYTTMMTAIQALINGVRALDSARQPPTLRPLTM